jgi:cullin 2
MGTFQIAILLAFQKTDPKTCGELMGITKLNPAQFQSTIQSLVNSKLLAVAAGNQDLSQPSTVISLNMDFWSSRSKFRLETVPETEATRSFIIKDRKEYLQVKNTWIFQCITLEILNT